MPRYLSRVLTTAAIVLSLGMFLRLILLPDPIGNMFLQAGRLEASGQTARAISRYELIATRHPDSSYAPRALFRAGDLLAAQGRQSGDKKALRQSINSYLTLTRTYPSDPFALTALQDAGVIAAQDLSNRPLARTIYTQIVKANGENSEIGAGAIVKLARLSIQDGNGKNAQTLLIGVLRRWNQSATVGAEAQYFLGICYETVFHNRDWASHAYDEVISRFPKSQWATDARERLGLATYADLRGVRPTRRVMLDIAPLPDESGDDDSDDGAMWQALRLALAARGLSGDATLLRGYSLAPFYAGLNPDNAGETVDMKADAWQNVAGAAGFRFSIKGGGREEEALRDLQDDLDAAHLPLVGWQDNGHPTWSLAVGYDSERGEVMLQNHGAQFDTLSAKAWAPSWKVPSSFGKNYTLISLVPTGKTAIANPSLTPTPSPTAKPGQTPKPVVGGPPSFQWEIAPIKESVPIERTAGRAAILLLRSGTDQRLLNGAALDYLAGALDSAARETRPASVAPTPTPQATNTPATTATGTTDTSIYDPTPTPAAATAPTPSPRELVARAQQLWPFWKAPATSWINKRREAAQWCRLAALKTNDARFNRAADLFDQSVAALQSASQTALPLDSANLEDNPGALEVIARNCRQARDAERAAAQLLG